MTTDSFEEERRSPLPVENGMQTKTTESMCDEDASRRWPRPADEGLQSLSSSSFSRRSVLLLAASAAVVAAGGGTAEAAGVEADGGLVWTSKAEILGRARVAGGTAATGKNATYPVRFITYLARILLNYDAASKQLWDKQARRIPLSYGAKQVAVARRAQFAEFAEAVELGLLDYQGKTGVKALFSLLRSRYATTPDRQRQLAILFSFAPGALQPTQQLQELLGEVDDARLSAADVTNRGSGYTGSRPPAVTVTGPQDRGGRQAVVRAVMRDTGRIARLELPEDDGCRQLYGEPPEVRISPPSDPSGVQAEAAAVLDSTGRLVGLTLTNRGTGYSSAAGPVTVEVFGAAKGDVSPSLCSAYQEVRPVLEREVSFLDIVHAGSGYATAVPAAITIEPPQVCGGEAAGTGASAIAFLARKAGGTEPNTLPLPATSLSSQLAQLLPSDVIDSLVFDADGRASILELEEASLGFGAGSIGSGGAGAAVVPGSGFEVANAADGEDGLPAVVEAAAAAANAAASSTFDPVFGPIGRSPLQQEAQLTVDDYLRLALAGALCNGLVRTALHPVDAVKTRMQAEPALGRTAAAAYEKLKAQGGQQVLKGIDVSAVLGFLLGFFGFGCNELFRRALVGYVGPEEAAGLTVPIILAASGGAQLVNSIVTCPWEGVRIRVMTQPGPFVVGNFVPVFGELLLGARGGPAAVFGGLGPLLFREVPFAVTKYLVFELSRDAIYSALPATQEGIFSSLTVSLACGLLGGVAAAIVSNPADAVLTRLNAPQAEAEQAAEAAVPAAAAKACKAPAMAATAAAAVAAGGDMRRRWFASARDASAKAGGSASSAAAGGSTPPEAAPRWGKATVATRHLPQPPPSKALARHPGAGPAAAGPAGPETAAMAAALAVEAPPRQNDWREELRVMQREPGGLWNLFNGIGVRSTFFGALIALQFFLFDYFKALLQVSPDDLRLVLDVFQDRLSFYDSGPGI
ncbi:unnamed protein product [Phaeothamnion confervicola]